MKLAIYKLKWFAWNCNYDEYDGFVIVANSEKTARNVAAKYVKSDWTKGDHWLDPTKTSCSKIYALELEPSENKRILLTSFHHG